MRKYSAYIYVYYIQDGELYILMGKGKPYHLSAMVRLKDYLEDRPLYNHDLSFFGPKKDEEKKYGDVIHGYRKEIKWQSILVDDIEFLNNLNQYIQSVAQGKININAPGFNFKTQKQDGVISNNVYGRYFGGLIGNPWISPLGGRVDRRVDKSIEDTAIRECMEEMGLIVMDKDKAHLDLVQDKQINAIRKLFYEKAKKNLMSPFYRCAQDDEDIYLYALQMEEEEIDQIVENFNPTLRVYEGGAIVECKNPYAESNIVKLFEEVDLYDQVRMNHQLEKRGLLSLSVSDLDEYFKKEGAEYDQDKQWVKGYLVQFGNLFIKYFPQQTELLTKLNDAIVRHVFEDRFLKIRSEIALFKTKYAPHKKILKPHEYNTRYGATAIYEEKDSIYPITSLCLWPISGEKTPPSNSLPYPVVKLPSQKFSSEKNLSQSFPDKNASQKLRKPSLFPGSSLKSDEELKKQRRVNDLEKIIKEYESKISDLSDKVKALRAEGKNPKALEGAITQSQREKDYAVQALAILKPSTQMSFV